MAPPRAGSQLTTNQTLVYDAEWRLFDAGTATLHLERAGNQDRVIASADAIGAIGLLYHVHDRFESVFDPKTFCSMSLAKQTEEGFRRLNTNIRYDYAGHKSVLEEKNLRNNQSKRQENEIPNCVSDVVAAIYYAGQLPLAADAHYYFPLNDGGKTATVDLHVEGKEDVKTPLGTFKTIRVEPSSQQGTLKDKGKIWIWYSDDERRIPVQMRARMFWGTLNLSLIRIDAK